LYVNENNALTKLPCALDLALHMLNSVLVPRY